MELVEDEIAAILLLHALVTEKHKLNSTRTHIDIFRCLIFPLALLSVSNIPEVQVIGLLTSYWVSLICQEQNKLLVIHAARKLVYVLLSYYLLKATLRKWLRA